MMHRNFHRAFLCLVLVSAFTGSLVLAQNHPGSRITGPIDERVRVTLKGNVHPLAQLRYDQGAVLDSFPVQRMFLVLRRPPEREDALRQFLEEAHTLGGTSYHKWLKPEQFGELYGPDDSEMTTVIAWLQRHGFSVAHVTKSKTAVEFSGTAGQLRETFGTEIHTYLVDGEEHHANDRDPQIPDALAPVIAGITPMNDFPAKSYTKVLGQASFQAETHAITPQWTLNTQPLLALGPSDFAVQYDLNPLYTAGVNGNGVTIGIISLSNVDPTIVAAYRTLFGLPAGPLNVIIDGSDPGQNGAVVEAHLDVEIAGSVAPGAAINLYAATGTTVQNGLVLATQRAVDDDQATILSTSYGICEQRLGSAGNQFWSNVWEQAGAGTNLLCVQRRRRSSGLRRLQPAASCAARSCRKRFFFHAVEHSCWRHGLFLHQLQRQRSFPEFGTGHLLELDAGEASFHLAAQTHSRAALESPVRPESLNQWSLRPSSSHHRSGERRRE